jgi:hypothetical protein
VLGFKHAEVKGLDQHCERTRAVMWTDKDDREIKYGEWNEYDAKDTLVEANKVKSAQEPEEIWPNWRDGVPTRFHRRIQGEAFFKNGNFHKEVIYYVPLQLRWNTPQSLTALEKNKYLLPDTHASEWSGVYRVFCTKAAIDRSCGRDETGTLYIGMAGAGIMRSSILRTRVKEIVDGRHQAFNLWRCSDMVRQKFPWDCLAVEWAFTGDRTDHKGEQVPAAIIAEGFLLNSYNDSYGEYPPWNQRV